MKLIENGQWMQSSDEDRKKLKPEPDFCRLILCRLSTDGRTSGRRWPDHKGELHGAFSGHTCLDGDYDV